LDDDQTAGNNVYEMLETAVGYAWQAYHEKDWLTSYSRWERIRQTWPGYPPPYIHAATSLSEISRTEEAESLLEEGTKKFPGEPQIALEYVWRLYKNGKYAASTAQFEAAMQRFPDNPEFGIDFLKIAI
jgi:kynurenine formamidase